LQYGGRNIVRKVSDDASAAGGLNLITEIYFESVAGNEREVFVVDELGLEKRNQVTIKLDGNYASRAFD
jgi:hypothetical protein